jgi:hypothetical protein
VLVGAPHGPWLVDGAVYACKQITSGKLDLATCGNKNMSHAWCLFFSSSLAKTMSIGVYIRPFIISCTRVAVHSYNAPRFLCIKLSLTTITCHNIDVSRHILVFRYIYIRIDIIVIGESRRVHRYDSVRLRFTLRIPSDPYYFLLIQIHLNIF